MKKVVATRFILIGWSQMVWGSLYLAFEQLTKKKLSAEGLFNLPKKQIPMFPKRIAVVTSIDGAVYPGY